MEKEQNYEKDVEDRVRREITGELKKKKGKTRKTAGLIISGVGGILYIINGFIFFVLGAGYYSWLLIPSLIAGITSEIGTIIGIFKVKIGGLISLSSIPISLVIGIIISFNIPNYYYYIPYTLIVVEIILLPMPLPHSLHVIAGGILCLTGSEN
jgi:hypothetical protein